MFAGPPAGTAIRIVAVSDFSAFSICAWALARAAAILLTVIANNPDWLLGWGRAYLVCHGPQVACRFKGAPDLSQPPVAFIAGAAPQTVAAARHFPVVANWQR